MVSKIKITLNFYSITSNFNDVLLKLCNKIVYSDESLYVNFDKSDTKKDVDKFLWISQRNNFLPHKTYGEKISKKDKIILFDGCYKKLQKSFQEKYKLNHFSEKATQLKFDEHNLKIKEKGQRYVNKNLQRCGLK